MPNIAEHEKRPTQKNLQCRTFKPPNLPCNKTTFRYVFENIQRFEKLRFWRFELDGIHKKRNAMGETTDLYLCGEHITSME